MGWQSSSARCRSRVGRISEERSWRVSRFRGVLFPDRMNEWLLHDTHLVFVFVQYSDATAVVMLGVCVVRCRRLKARRNGLAAPSRRSRGRSTKTSAWMTREC